jgi:hypothetical protein
MWITFIFTATRWTDPLLLLGPDVCILAVTVYFISNSFLHVSQGCQIQTGTDWIQTTTMNMNPPETTPWGNRRQLLDFPSDTMIVIILEALRHSLLTLNRVMRYRRCN